MRNRWVPVTRTGAIATGAIIGLLVIYGAIRESGDPDPPRWLAAVVASLLLVASVVFLVGLVGVALTSRGWRIVGAGVAAVVVLLPIAFAAVALLLMYGQAFRGWGWPE
jgi:ABC-type polysaccharide/polyol phosphate export permease